MVNLNAKIRAAKTIGEMAAAIEPALWGFITQAIQRDYTLQQIETLAATPAKVNARIHSTLGRILWRYETRYAKVPEMRLELSGDLTRRGSFDEIRGVFLHEIAHVLERLVPRSQSPRCHQPKSHGPEWQRLAIALGVPAKSTTSVGYAPRRKAQKIVGRCERCGNNVKRATRLRRHLTYRHLENQCGGRIQPTF